jgi:glutathione S-transferase
MPPIARSCSILRGNSAANRASPGHAGFNSYMSGCSKQDAGGFAPRVAAYLAKKYGYSPEMGAAYGDRVVDMLGVCTARLKAQHAAGSRYLVGSALTAADVYCATCMAMFAPLPESQCRMDPATRSAFETRDARTAAALDAVLLAHRDFMYATHLELPLAL